MMRILTLFSFLLFFTACSSNQVESIKYYDFTLHKQFNSVENAQDKSTYLHIGQVDIEGVADQQALVQILSDNSINIANYHYWSQHPKYTLTNSLQRRLSNENSGIKIIPIGKKNIEVDELLLEITVNKLAGHYQAGSIIEGQWFIYKQTSNGKVLLDSQLFSVSTKLEESGFSALIQAHEKSWNKLVDTLQKQVLQ